jgi:hypothetical protein
VVRQVVRPGGEEKLARVFRLTTGRQNASSPTDEAEDEPGWSFDMEDEKTVGYSKKI